MIHTATWVNLKTMMMRIQGTRASQVALVVRNLPAIAEDVGSIPGPGRSPGGGHDNPLQDSCLGDSMDRGASWARARGHKELDSTEHTALTGDLVCKTENDHTGAVLDHVPSQNLVPLVKLVDFRKTRIL